MNCITESQLGLPCNEYTYGKVFNQCNTNISVREHIKEDQKYLISLPKINTFLVVVCTFVGINVCDMFIKATIKNGEVYTADSAHECIISYQYSNYDTISYSSHSSKEKCILYSFTDQ